MTPSKEAMEKAHRHRACANPAKCRVAECRRLAALLDAHAAEATAMERQLRERATLALPDLLAASAAEARDDAIEECAQAVEVDERAWATHDVASDVLHDAVLTIRALARREEAASGPASTG